MQLVLERRLDRPRHSEFTFPLIALALALIFSGILLWIFGANPFETYAAMAAGAFGQRYHISETILRAIPLMLTGLSVGIAFRMLFWNIGAEGQFVWASSPPPGSPSSCPNSSAVCPNGPSCPS